MDAVNVASLSGVGRELLGRYVRNAIADPLRRRVPAKNVRLRSLLDEPGGAQAFHNAGWRQTDCSYYVVESLEALQQMKTELERIDLVDSQLADRHLPCASIGEHATLIGLPGELCAQVLSRLKRGDLCACRRVCTRLLEKASHGHLWIRHCSRKMRERVHHQTFASSACRRLDRLWFQVARLEELWTRLEARAVSSIPSEHVERAR